MPEIPPVDLAELGLAIEKAASTVVSQVVYPEPMSWLSTGITLLDCTIHSGGLGLPSGRPLHLYGPPASGKTLISYMAGAMAQKQGGIFINVDTEHFSPDLADLVGLDYTDPDKFKYYRPDTLEQAMDLLESLYVACANIPVPVVILLDSMVGCDALSNQDTVMSGQTYQQGKPPQLWSRFFKRMPVKRAAYSNVVMIFTNQVRLKLDFFSRGPTKVAPLGGYAVAHNMHLEVGCGAGPMYYCGSGKTDKGKAKNKTVVGQWIQAKATKNRMGPVHRPIGFPLYYNWGVDDALANLDFLTDHGGKVFKRAGSRYQYEGKSLYLADWHKRCLEDDHLCTELRQLTVTRYRELYHDWDEDQR